MSDKSKVEAIYQLSPLQEGMLFHTAADAERGLYFEQTTYTLAGRVDARRFRAAWQRVIDRHAILRTAFNKASTVQIVFRKAAAPWSDVDLRALPEGGREAEMRRYLAADRREGFDVTTAPLVRFALVRYAETTYKFVVSYHHALLDGWSYVQVLREVMAFYEAMGRGVELRLPEPRPFRDYIRWLRQQDQGAAEAFWRERLRGVSEPTYLCYTGRGRTAVGDLREVESVIDIEGSGLAELARGSQVTLNTVVQGAWALLLSRYAGQAEVLFGATVSGRPPGLAGVESMVGLFINTLPVRVRVEGGAGLREWLRTLQRAAAEGYGYEWARLSDVQGWAGAGAGRALFDTLVVFENYPAGADGEGASFAVEGEESWERVNYPAALVASVGGGGLRLRLAYDEEAVGRGRGEGVLRQLVRLLRQMGAEPEAHLDDLRLLDEEGERSVKDLGRGARQDYGPAARVEELIERQARLRPEAVAVADEVSAYSYAELEARAARVAARLRRLGVVGEERVGVLLPRGAEAVSAMLGVWKAGGAYVPLDASYPEERLASMLRDSGARCVISRRDVHAATRLGECVRVWLEEIEDDPHEPAEDVSADKDVEALAYVIYTSGSTGTPKGVGVTHRNLYNLVRWHVAEYEVTERDCMTQIASLGFDASVWELWPALASGARIEVVPEEARGEADALGRWMKQKGITISFMPTPMAEAVLNGGVSMPDTFRTLLIGGDSLRRWADPHAAYQLVNHYGPTECTVLASCGLVAAHGDGLPPLGRPVTNARLYVLDAAGRLCPVGVHGELYIGGAGVARGYINRPGLTAERFLPDPFSAEAGARLYRTGDVVRWREDGELEFLGRADRQVKLRGYRVELGEVEAALARHAGVRQCAVEVRDVAGAPTLVVYVEGAAGSGELREYLSERLPSYMVPQRYVRLDALPLTPNGKLDRKRLPEVAAAGEEGADHQEPRTPVEELVAGVWCEVLGLSRVGLGEDFFALGGHSLLAAQVVARLRGVFGVEVGLRTLFERPTVRGVAGEVERLREEGRGAEGAASVPPPVRAAHNGRAPLSFAQQRLWFLQQLEPHGASYNVPFAVRLAGALDVTALRSALTEVVRRHEVLRTTFPIVDGEPVQLIHPPQSVPVPVIDLRDHDAAWCERASAALVAAEAAQPFDLSAGPLLRARLLRLTADEHVLTLTMHHIVSDGWSMGVLVSEFTQLYEAARLGQPSPLSELPVQYADYAVWQRGWLQGEALEAQLGYWRRQLEGLERLELAGDKARAGAAAATGGAAGVVRFEVSAEVTQRLRVLSRAEGVTLFMTLLAGFQLLLSRYTGRVDVAVGTDVAGRGRVEVEGLIGFFVNQLVLRTQVGGCGSVGELLGRVREAVLGAYAHQEVPFERLVEELAPDRAEGSPLFSSKLILQNVPRRQVTVDGLLIDPLDELSTGAKLDLHLAIEEQSETNSLSCVLTCPQALFGRERMQRFAAHYLRVLEFFGRAENETRLANFELLDQAERQAMLGLGHEETIAITGTVVEWVEESAAARPSALALAGSGPHFTYAQLSAQSSRLAAHLRALGVGPETRVALHLGSSTLFPLAALAVWKAGGAYLPLDPSHPAERLAALIEDSGVALLITHSSLRAGLPAHWAVEVSLDEDWAEVEARPAQWSGPAPGPRSLAYIIYTSGSTGGPKGVMVEQAQLADYVRAAQARLGLDAGLGCALVSTPAADLGHTVLYPALAAGATLHVLGEEVARDGEAAGRYLRERGVGCVKLTPSHLRAWLGGGAEGLALRKVVLGGEALTGELVARARDLSPGCEVWNHYGPTETTVGVAAGLAQARAEEVAALGRPLANRRLYVLDGGGRVCPVGVYGELYIGGAGVARGYVNRPGLTAERFLPDPFSTEPGARLYRTGDVVRWREDGQLEFLGRADRQVKLRGYRVELGEVEAALARHAGVQQCAVEVREVSGAQTLVAYVSGAAEAGELREYLSERLPSYMVPQRYVRLDALPLTPNGKLDRKRLPEVAAAGEEGASHEEPRRPVEELVAGVWCEVLGLSRVGVGEDFFALGGHSLLAAQVVARLRVVFGVEVGLRVLFERPTVRGVAGEVKRLRKEGRGAEGAAAPLVRAEHNGPAPLSFAQQRLWFIEQLKPGNTAYNSPQALRLEGALDVSALRSALNEVVRRHEVLRTTFPSAEGEPVQLIHKSQPVPVPVVDLSGLVGRERVARALAEAEAARPFDLSAGPLLRVRLLRLGTEDHVLAVVLHHIVSDGWSMGVLVSEFTQLYEAARLGQSSPLEELPVQYADYSIWQRGWLQGEVLEAQLSYWRRQLEGLERLELPGDVGRGAGAGVVRFEVSAEVTGRLRVLSRAEGVTLFMTLLAGFQLLLSRYTGRVDVAVGTDMAGRGRVEVEGLIGFFVNQLVLRTQVGGCGSVGELLGRVREAVLGAYAHQEVPFERLVEELAPDRAEGSPLFRHAISLQRQREAGRLQVAGMKLSSMTLDVITTKRDIDILLFEGDSISGFAHYDAGLFSAPFMERMVQGFQSILEQFAHGADVPLGGITLARAGSDSYAAQLAAGVEMLEV